MGSAPPPILPRLPVPADWVPFALAPPAIDRSHGVTVDGWAGWRTPSDTGHSVSGCFGLGLSTWTNEAEPLAFERIDALAGSVAREIEPALSLHIVNETRNETTTTHLLAREPDGPPVAETFLGFVSDGAPRLEACFVLCVASREECALLTEGAAPPTYVASPPATLLVRSLVLGMHHPMDVAGAGVALFLSLGVLAVATRPRPRRK